MTMSVSAAAPPDRRKWWLLVAVVALIWLGLGGLVAFTGSATPAVGASETITLTLPVGIHGSSFQADSANTGDLAGLTCPITVVTANNESIHNNDIVVRSATTFTFAGFDSVPGVQSATGSITLGQTVTLSLVLNDDVASGGATATITCSIEPPPTDPPPTDPPATDPPATDPPPEPPPPTEPPGTDPEDPPPTDPPATDPPNTPTVTNPPPASTVPPANTLPTTE